MQSQMDDTSIAMSSASIEYLKFASQLRFSPDAFYNIDARVVMDDIADNLVYSLKACVLGEQGSRITIQYPATWWEAVKERFAPQWFRRRWPVLYTRHDITPQTIYPNLKISLPAERHHIRMNHDESLLM